MATMFFGSELFESSGSGNGSGGGITAGIIYNQVSAADVEITSAVIEQEEQ